MSKIQNEINDNEIRIISAYEPEKRKPKRRPPQKFIFIILGIIVAIGIIAILIRPAYEPVKEPAIEVPPTAAEEPAAPIQEEIHARTKGFTTALDTTVNKHGLLILSPEHARPRLIVGTESLNDSNIVLATQAADVRGDNGQIAGTFVLNGELIGKGEAKAGFCSIINGELSLGIAEATPMLEQTLTDGGYFFRQYPLVVGGQIVENKPKGKAIRKALAEIGGKIYVVMSRDKLTFHDFSQLLTDIGTRNAIYLVGSTSHGFYVTEQGDRIQTGNAPWKEVENVSYIVWDCE